MLFTFVLKLESNFCIQPNAKIVVHHTLFLVKLSAQKWMYMHECIASMYAGVGTYKYSPQPRGKGNNWTDHYVSNDNIKHAHHPHHLQPRKTEKKKQIAYSGMSCSRSGEAAAHKASALASNTLLMKLPPARVLAMLLLIPATRYAHQSRHPHTSSTSGYIRQTCTLSMWTGIHTQPRFTRGSDTTSIN